MSNKSCSSRSPGIVFLSGGQSDEDATAHLNLMNKMTSSTLGSYHTPMVGRYKQTPTKVGEATEDSDISSQTAFSHRAKMNSWPGLVIGVRT